MSINMADVKQIMYNNKEVTKIEDSLGNILWQKQVGPTPFDPTILYYIDDAKSTYKVDIINKTITQYTTINGSYNIVGSRIAEYNGQLYATSGNVINTLVYLVTIDDDSQTLTYTDSDVTHINANSSFKIGSDHYSGADNGLTTTVYPFNNSTPKWTFSGNNRIYANGVMYFNNKYFTKRYNNYFAEYDPNTDNWVNNNMPMPASSAQAYQFWVFNGNLYYSQGTNQKVYNPNTNTWSNAGWTGQTNFNGARIFTDGTNAYMLGGTGTSNKIYKLNGTTWDLYWTIPYTWRGDYFINKHGTAQLAQNARPKIE